MEVETRSWQAFSAQFENFPKCKEPLRFGHPPRCRTGPPVAQCRGSSRSPRSGRPPTPSAAGFRSRRPGPLGLCRRCRRIAGALRGPRCAGQAPTIRGRTERSVRITFSGRRRCAIVATLTSPFHVQGPQAYLVAIGEQGNCRHVVWCTCDVERTPVHILDVTVHVSHASSRKRRWPCRDQAPGHWAKHPTTNAFDRFHEIDRWTTRVSWLEREGAMGVQCRHFCRVGTRRFGYHMSGVKGFAHAVAASVQRGW